MKNNLGLLVRGTATEQARVDRIRALSALLPTLTGSIASTSQQIDIASFGFNFPGIPKVIGPFGYTDLRASASQRVFDWTALKNRQSALQREKAVALSVQDGRDLVVEAVASAYLQIISDAARIEATKAQVTTAQALYERARDQHAAGTSPAIDELRAQVELKTQQQVLIAQENQRAKDKLSLARVIGLAPGQEFELSDTAPYVAMEGMTPEAATQRAYQARADYQSAEMQLRAAETARLASLAERYPTLQVDGNYGDLGKTIAELAWHLHGNRIAAIQHL